MEFHRQKKSELILRFHLFKAILLIKELRDFLWFHGMSTFVGYLMPIPFYTYIKYIISKTHFVDNIFKQASCSFFFFAISNNLVLHKYRLNVNSSISNNSV